MDAAMTRNLWLLSSFDYVNAEIDRHQYTIVLLLCLGSILSALGEYKDHRLIGFGAYGVATIVGVSRYIGRNHFLSDLLVGSAMGEGLWDW